MPRAQTHRHTPPPTILPARAFRQYLVARQEDAWFIQFDGESFGPYNSEREALLFAIDAAHKLGEKGEDTQVLRRDETGETRAAWTCGRDAYPPKQP